MVAELVNRKVVRVPETVGQPLAKARILMEDAGLGRVVVLFREGYEEPNTVVDQRPARGQMVYEDTEVTIWVARRGYMQHLPALYRRSDAVGHNVVRDICFIFEHIFGSIEEKIDGNHRYYDPHTAPGEFLTWLASWTAFTVDLDWPEPRKRALIKRAVDLYRIRGTKRALALFLKLFTGYEPDIEENVWPFKGFRVETEARIGIDSVILPPVNLAHCYIITIPVKFEDVTPELVFRIHQIVQLEKPAHTNYYLRFLEEQGDVELREFFAIGMRSGIGIGAEVVSEIPGED
ncbi:MAG: PASTA domain-containing protein [Kofleriaceae bacterium]|nr:PASTA domain-containing protein [Kofleriaceae bacterium]MCL4228594.1 PASTA domain-containing protein [Myxococcales bacterium]